MGKDVRRERGSQEEDIRGRLSLVKMPPLTIRGNRGAWCRASEADKAAGQVHQVHHVNQQIDGSQDGHSQSLVPGAHVGAEFITAAHVAGPLGLPAELPIELVERPEDHSRGIEEGGEQVQPQMHKGDGDRQPVVPVVPVQQEGHS